LAIYNDGKSENSGEDDEEQDNVSSHVVSPHTKPNYEKVKIAVKSTASLLQKRCKVAVESRRLAARL